MNTAAASPSAPSLFERWSGLAPGLLLAGALAWAAVELSGLGWLQSHGISALTLAIVIGMLVGNTVYPRIAAPAKAGVGFAKQTLLRLGIILFGLRLTFQDVGQVGVAGIVIDALVLCSTFGLACFLGTRVFGVDRKTAMLIGAGSSICGAAAVMATEPVVEGRPDQVTVAVSTVVVFGTLAIFLYPLLGSWLDLSHVAYGLYTGSTVHEVAQVVAAGNAVSAESANIAVIAKMVRVMMLAPFLIALSAWLARDQGAEGAPAGGRRGVVIPWFAVGFVVMTALHSLVPMPKAAVDFAIAVDTVLLAMAMAALGLTTHVSAIRSAGVKPLVLAALLFGWLIGGGLAINHLVTALLG